MVTIWRICENRSDEGRSEVEESLKSAKTRKAPGIDAITIETIQTV